MTTLTEIRAALEIQYPTLSESINDEDKLLNQAERARTLDGWAQNLHNQELATQALEAAAIAKAALLQRLGITADEAALLLG